MRRVWMLVLVMIMLGAAPALAGGNSDTYTAHLDGAGEVPDVVTLAQGQAVFKVGDGEISYRLIASNIDQAVQAHIHLGTAEVNGPVVAFLFGPSAGVDNDGVLATGTITAANLRGPLLGADLQALIDAMEDGEAYVNVHTVANPGGEIRGQIG